jgi:hypothetical protein
MSFAGVRISSIDQELHTGTEFRTVSQKNAWAKFAEVFSCLKERFPLSNRKNIPLSAN